jgi:hypothetical protein
MFIRSLWLIGFVVWVSGCAQLDEWTSTTPKSADVTSSVGQAVEQGALYVTADAPANVSMFRNIYIAPANLANMQVIQPEGVTTDSEWWVTDEEGAILQRTIVQEFSVALTYLSDFNIVTSPEQAQLMVNTSVVAVHPNETRASIAKGARSSGSITVSIAVVNTATDKVVVRAVDTRSSEDVWAFNEVKDGDPALNPVFQSIGSDIRRGILQLQGRSDPALGQLPL